MKSCDGFLAHFTPYVLFRSRRSLRSDLTFFIGDPFMIRIVLASALIAAALAAPTTAAEIALPAANSVVDRSSDQAHTGHWDVYGGYWNGYTVQWVYIGMYHTQYEADHAVQALLHSGWGYATKVPHH
jgi:hypothetical protein